MKPCLKKIDIAVAPKISDASRCCLHSAVPHTSAALPVSPNFSTLFSALFDACTAEKMPQERTYHSDLHSMGLLLASWVSLKQLSTGGPCVGGTWSHGHCQSLPMPSSWVPEDPPHSLEARTWLPVTLAHLLV